MCVWHVCVCFGELKCLSIGCIDDHCVTTCVAAASIEGESFPQITHHHRSIRRCGCRSYICRCCCDDGRQPSSASIRHARSCRFPSSARNACYSTSAPSSVSLWQKLLGKRKSQNCILARSIHQYSSVCIEMPYRVHTQDEPNHSIVYAEIQCMCLSVYFCR